MKNSVVFDNNTDNKHNIPKAVKIPAESGICNYANKGRMQFYYNILLPSLNTHRYLRVFKPNTQSNIPIFKLNIVDHFEQTGILPTTADSSAMVCSEYIL